MNKIISTQRLFLFLTLICLITACKDTNSRQKGSNPSQDTIAQKVPNIEEKPDQVILYAWVNQLRVRAEADKKAAVVAEIAEGNPLKFLNEKSDFTEKINLRGTLFDEPWLKVETEDGKVGWVYGGGVKFYAPKIDAAPSPFDDCFKLRNVGKWSAFNACMESTAQKQLEANARWVKDSGDELVITLLDGTEKRFIDKTLSMEEDNFQYSYSHYLPKMGFHVLALLGYEWTGYLLVNDKSGTTQELYGFPKASPDHQHLVITNIDLEAGFEVNGVGIWGFNDNGFEVLFNKELTEYGPTNPIWLDEKTVEITMIPYPNMEGVKQKLAHLRLGDDGAWRLVFKE